MSTTERRYPKEEFARRGDEIYERDIKPKLKPRDKGKFLAIDIETGDYEIDSDEMQVCHRLRERIPQAQIWLKRVGYAYVHRFGGSSRKTKP